MPLPWAAVLGNGHYGLSTLNLTLSAAVCLVTAYWITPDRLMGSGGASMTWLTGGMAVGATKLDPSTGEEG